MARPGVRRRTERQRIETGNRTRTHGENVAQNATDAGGRALIGLNVAWMVMALHLEHDCEPVADIDHAGVLARPLDHPRRLRRQRAQVDFRRLVRAVLVPHRRENAELGDRGFAADEIEDALILVGLEPMRGDQLRRDLGFPLGSLAGRDGRGICLPGLGGFGAGASLACPGRRFGCHGPSNVLAAQMSWPGATPQVGFTEMWRSICETRASPGFAQC